MQSRRTDNAALFLNALQLAMDACACLLGFVAAYWLYKNTSILESFMRQKHVPWADDYYLPAASFAVFVLVSFSVKHLYQSRETGLMNMDEATAVMQGLFLSSAVVICGSYFMADPVRTRISRLILGLGVVLGCMGVLAVRALGFKLRRYMQTRGHFFRRVVICGAGEAGRTIARKLLHSPKFHILPVAFLDDELAKQNTTIDCLVGYEPIPVEGRLHNLPEVIDKYHADEVWIAITQADQNTIIDIALAAGDCDVPCRFVPNLYQIPLDTLTVETMGGIPLLSIKPRDRVQRMPFTKRLFDILFSLIVLFNPVSLVLFPLIALLVRMTSPGPVFFAQQRIGQGGRAFIMYKFRTMHADAPAYAVTPRSSGDQRITLLGRWLRKLSIDELPQFWNVLRGDMSVVGPRPEMPQIVEHYTSLQRQRLCVKPGITGIWQISADRRNPIHENLDYDLYYIEKQSFFLDLMIILTTGFYGARGV
ncbi:MAG TPA: sugar transferase [Planctomycetota bacterium]|jgi:exopolysaccharide biosynthesis polyprenyl glycosylphosphotransferase